MQVFQKSIGTFSESNHLEIPFDPQLFLLFVSPTYDDPDGFLHLLHEAYPNASLFGCSTAGEILGNHVQDATVALTAIRFEKTTFRQVEVDLEEVRGNSCKAGKEVLKRLNHDSLRHILILSDGLNVNGAELVKGLHDDLPEGVHVTGGLAGDGPDFKDTFIVSGNRRSSRKIVALGLYGSDLQIGFGSKGGWDSFGIERLVTRSQDNILYELDGQPALELYKSFLGDKAKDLPGSGLLFPLSMRQHEDKAPVVRTILAVNEEDQSLTFAGNIPENSYVRLMKANVDRIINGAEQSAMITRNGSEVDTQLAILISCVGRRLVMKQLVEEEVEAVNEVLGDQVYSTGFYSYGEIAPFDQSSPCELHNQTMTITTFAE
jgi:hypothetical protein